MHGHGRRYQASIDMVELQVLISPIGTIDDEDGPITIREFIINCITKDSQRVFLSVTKKWGSAMWQANFVTQHKHAAHDFATCPAAWMAFEIHDAGVELVYKHFSPEAVKEASQSTCDDVEMRMITPSEEEAIKEEQEISSIP